MKRKRLAVLLAVLMVLSMLPAIVAPKTAVAETVTPHDAIEGGAILHCFNWTYNEIRANLADIAAAGYVAVQTSPVQQGKDYDASYMDSKGQWWKLYQPLGLRVAPDVDGVPTSFLGTKDELEALCDEAEALGLYVIVDIVVNHLANKTGGGYYVDGEVNLSEQVDEEYQDHPEYFHHNTDGVNDGSRYNMTQNQMGMPDLNTSNEYIQEQVYALLKECVDCGVDGFRFDAAKHIELPGDPDASSDFWPAILNGDDTDGDIVGIRPYVGAENLFIYGESLSGNAGESWVDEFTNNYMALTDSNYGGRMRDALNGTNAGMLGDGTYVRCSNAAGNVVWVESHDTYEDGASSGLESDKIVKAWAIVGARANSTALYLARPNEIMGVASSDTTWKSTAVAEINAFKNHYDGTGEYLHKNYDNKVAWIERGANGNAGVSIAKLDGAGAVSLELEWMADGYYEDEITGNVFTVSNGTITGNVGPTGVAVVYNTTSYTPPTPSEYITADPIYFVPTGWWTNDSARFEMWLFNNNGGMFVSLTDADNDGTYEGALPEGNWTGVIFVHMDPNGSEHDWDSKWNQTDNLVPDPGTNCFTITAGSSSGTWSVYGGTPNPDAGYYLVGSMTGWAIVPEYKMTRTNAETEEYMIETELIRTSSYSSQVKAVYSPDGVTKQTWYPDGFDNNYGDYDGELTVSGVYKIYFRPNYDGGSDWHDNCLYAEQSKYFVTVSDADKNGVVTVNKDTAAEGDTVTVTVTPHEGYMLDTLVYRYETEPDTMNFESVAIENGSFTMPAYNVTVIATFVQDGALADGYYLVPDSDPTVENINPAHRLTLFTDLDQEGHVFNYFTTYAVTGNFGENTYRIVKVAGNAIVPFDLDQEPLVVTTTGATETVYLATEPAGQYTWIYDYGSGVSALNGYYLVIGNSPVPEITEDYAFEETETAGLYLFEGILYGSDIFVCRLENGRCVARYPAGSYMDSTEVAQNLGAEQFNSGFYRLTRVWFRPDGQGTPVGTDYYGDYGKWFHGYFMYEVLNRVMINESEHGTVTADKMTAEAGETVTLTITPDPGYELDTLTVVNDYNETVEVTDNAFEMTIWEAKVTATFKEAAAAEPEFKTHALALEGKIGVNFFMDLSGLSDDEKAASYMTFAITGAQPVSAEPVPFDANNMNVTGTYYGFSCYVTSIQMADTITATYHYGDGLTVSHTYSIAQYIDSFDNISDQFDDKTVNLVHALADYGHYMQAFLADQKGWNLSDESVHKEMDKYYADGYEYDSIAEILSVKAIYRDFQDENIVKAPYTVILDSDTAIRVFFKPAAGFNGDVSAFWDNKGEVYLTRGSDGRYMVEIANIPAHLLGDTHTINVFTGEDCFKPGVYGAYTQVNVSAMSYVYGILTSAAYADNLAAKAGVASLFAYWQAAQAYKESH
ncbi:MAG: hypothetical protein IKP38_06305 [Clostridia bacterium]|nr:hypothetical protein [Clostridia bacterium]